MRTSTKPYLSEQPPGRDFSLNRTNNRKPNRPLAVRNTLTLTATCGKILSENITRNPQRDQSLKKLHTEIAQHWH